jgi:prepilin-type N-terminal cleavage/methylation domain-containing protein
MKRQRQQGFTLIEIMLAVAILAIIAAIAIPAYRGYISEARIGTVIKDIRQMELILNDLAMDAGLAALDAGNTTERGVYLLSGQLVLASPSATPSGAEPWLDPWGRIYRYQRPPTRTDGGGSVSNASTMPQGYDLFSQGVDAADASDDLVRGCNGEFVGLQSDHPSC